MRVTRAASMASSLGALTAMACSSNDTTTTVTDSSSGAVIGPLDHHCLAADGGLMIQPIGVCDVADPSLVPTSAGCPHTEPATGGC